MPYLLGWGVELGCLKHKGLSHVFQVEIQTVAAAVDAPFGNGPEDFFDGHGAPDPGDQLMDETVERRNVDLCVGMRLNYVPQNHGVPVGLQ